MDPATDTAGQPVAETNNEQVETGNRMNRKDYKMSPGKQFRIRFNDLNARYIGKNPVPRETTIAQMVNDEQFPWELDLHEVCLPEWLQEKLYVRSICGSMKAARAMRNEMHVYYAFDYCALLFMIFLFPAIGLTTLGFAIASPVSVPIWFPYIGTFFYIMGLPMLFLSILSFGLNYQYAMNIDDKNLKLIVGLVVFVVFICLPVYGIWATVSYVQQGAVIAVEHTLGLKIGAYICCALSIPCWIYSMFPIVVLFGEVGIYDTRAKILLFVFSFTVVTSLLVGSMIHQILVGKLIWFPYLGVLGTLFVIPAGCITTVLVAVKTTEWIVLDEDVLFIVVWLLYTGLTDGLAWLLVEKDFSQPVELLIDDTLLYTGAIIAYIALVLLWILVTTWLARAIAHFIAERRYRLRG